MMLQVFYEDNQVLVAVKPQDVPSQPDVSGDESFLDAAREYIRIKYNKPGAAYLGLVHRLDRPAGGLMVFARTSKAAARLSAQIREGRFDKTYYAVVRGAPDPEAVLEDYLQKDTARNTSRVVQKNAAGAKFARLSYRLCAAAGDLALVRIQLDTGRAHQIRVQMQHAGHPLAGDYRYGGPPADHLCLWAARLAFDHPTKKERMEFVCPWPDEPPWNRFAFSM